MSELDLLTIGEDIALLEGIRTTRAIRRLKPDPVPIDLVKKVCEAGTFAPSGGNRQPGSLSQLPTKQNGSALLSFIETTFESTSNRRSSPQNSLTTPRLNDVT